MGESVNILLSLFNQLGIIDTIDETSKSLDISKISLGQSKTILRMCLFCSILYIFEYLFIHN